MRDSVTVEGLPARTSRIRASASGVADCAAALLPPVDAAGRQGERESGEEADGEQAEDDQVLAPATTRPV